VVFSPNVSLAKREFQFRGKISEAKRERGTSGYAYSRGFETLKDLTPAIGVLAGRSIPVGVNQLAINIGYSEDG